MIKPTPGFYEELNTKIHSVIYTPNGLYYSKSYLVERLSSIIETNNTGVDLASAIDEFLGELK